MKQFDFLSHTVILIYHNRFYFCHSKIIMFIFIFIFWVRVHTNLWTLTACCGCDNTFHKALLFLQGFILGIDFMYLTADKRLDKYFICTFSFFIKNEELQANWEALRRYRVLRFKLKLVLTVGAILLLLF